MKETDCKTKYPLLLVHGMGFRDHKLLNYWGRIPSRLEAHGAQVFYGWQDSVGSTEQNAKTVLKNLDRALELSGAEKVNIIAHSKGGLEARLIAGKMGQAHKIASISTINTPHNGSLTVDALMKLPHLLVRFAGACTSLWMRILGDRTPDAYACFNEFTTAHAERFNTENPVPQDVLCQSFAFKMKSAASDLTMLIPYLVVKHFDGESDGLLNVRAVKWADFRGVYTSSGRRGISHPDQVDIRRMRFTRKPPQNDHEISDICDFYLRLVSELREKGL